MRYGQLVMGPAGSGKSTYCSNVVKYCTDMKRTVHVINLDPAAEVFSYPVSADIRDLVQVDDVMSDNTLQLGPNGGLVFCMEYLVQNLSWLEEQLEGGDDDYFIFDCPGQIELYTHLTVMRQIVEQLKQWNFNICGVFLLDSQFLIDTAKFFSGIMTALSTMVTLELPHINVLSKIDLLDKQAKKELDKYLDPETSVLLNELSQTTNKKYHKLNKAICSLIDDYGLVNFIPLDMSEEDSLKTVLLYIDNTIQYGEDLDVKVPGLEGADDEYEDMEDNG